MRRWEENWAENGVYLLVHSVANFLIDRVANLEEQVLVQTFFWKEWTGWNPAKGKNALVHWLLSIALRTSPCIEFHTSALARCCKPEKNTDIFRIGSWGNDLESRSRWVRTHLLVDSRTLLLVDSGALLLIDCRTLFLVDRWALLLIHCVAHLEVWDAVFSISNFNFTPTCSFTVSWTVRHCCSWTVEHCCSFTVEHCCSLTVEHCCSLTVEHCCSLTVSYFVSHFCSFTVLHCCSCTVLQTWKIQFKIQWGKIKLNLGLNLLVR